VSTLCKLLMGDSGTYRMTLQFTQKELKFS